MPKILSLHLFTFALLFVSLLASNYKVNPSTLFFVDQYNRSVLFHGVNVVYKLPPYYPILDKFDPINSLCDQDYQNLRQWGLNSIRLYMSWEGTEQVRGQYNQTYMSIVQNITREAAKYNISVILDAHQDMISRKFCGEGFPDWAVNRTNFPAPMTVNMTFDDQGHANLTVCLNTSIHDMTRTDDVQKAFDSFYQDVDGIAESFTNFWQAVAAFFKDEPNVIGYELLNEPNPGTLKFIDRDYLTPLYKRIHEKIRQVDNETIIIFEPSIWDAGYAGFTEGPGGPEYNDRQVLAYHIYCGTSKPDLCDVETAYLMLTKAGSAVKLNLAGFMTEFGASPNTEDAAKNLDTYTGAADKYLHSWSYWMYKSYQDITGDRPPSTESFYNDDGTLQELKIKAMARSYAYVTCGVPKEQKFESNTGNFEYSYKANSGCQGQRTEIFLSKEYYYPNGFEAKFENCDQCQLVQISSSETNYYAVEVPAGIAEGTLIKITVTPIRSSSSLLEKEMEEFLKKINAQLKKEKIYNVV